MESWNVLFFVVRVCGGWDSRFFVVMFFFSLFGVGIFIVLWSFYCILWVFLVIVFVIGLGRGRSWFRVT